MADQRNRNRNRRRSGLWWWMRRSSFWGGGVVVMLVVGFIVALIVVEYSRGFRERAAGYDLEKIDDVEIPSIILDRNEREIGRIFVQNRSVMKIEDVPELFIDALRAGEDSRFNTHKGVDYIGVLRAVKLNFQAGTTTQGASTITQQLARNAYPLKQDAISKGEGGLKRKLVEAFLARRIEQRFSKREILGFYLNRIYFGSGFYGLRSASLGYFGKEPRELSLAECATIVGLIKNPTNYSPLNNPRQSKVSRDNVINRMRVEGMLTMEEVLAAQGETVRTNPQPLRRGTSHLYERVADAVASALGQDALAGGGYKIHTTISSEVQEAAERALAISLKNAEARPGYVRQKYGQYRAGVKGSEAEYLQGAVLMVDHVTGEVIAHVGGRDYTQVPFDFIEMGTRPMGTAFYPFLYSVALAGKHTPASVVEDEPMDNRAVMVGGREGILGEWGMEVAAPRYDGTITLRRAFEGSKVAATVRLGAEVGLQNVIDAGVEFGFPMKKAEPLPRLSVGWETASLKQAVGAISTFPLGGYKGPASFVYLDRVENAVGKIVYRRKVGGGAKRRLLDAGVAWQMHSMMQGGMETGSARGLGGMLVEKPFAGAGKGGTTHDFADAWFLGYNGRVTCGVWTGFLKNNEAIYEGAFSRDLAMPVWAAAMNAAAPAFGGAKIPRPDALTEIEICSVSGQRATQFCQESREDLATGNVKSLSTAVAEYFRKGQENIPFCSLHSGATAGGVDASAGLGNLPVLDILPVRPKGAVLIGEDPYHTELPRYGPMPSGGALFQRRTNVLDSLDLGEFDEEIKLRKPARLDIEED